MSIRIGFLLRHEDETGVSGVGKVAEWIEFSDGEVVVHWISNTPSTNHYRNFKQMVSVHGHNGKTQPVVLADCEVPVHSCQEPEDLIREEDNSPPAAEKI